MGHAWFSGPFLALLLTLPTGVPAGEAVPGPALHAVVKDFTVTDLDGRALSLGQLRGKVVLVDFWATWCGPCRDAVPGLKRLDERYRGRGLVVLGLSLDETAEPVRRFRVRLKIDYPVALAGLPLIKASFGRVLGLPTVFVIDRQGRLAARYPGGADPADLEKEVQSLL